MLIQNSTLVMTVTILVLMKPNTFINMLQM